MNAVPRNGFLGLCPVPFGEPGFLRHQAGQIRWFRLQFLSRKEKRQGNYAPVAPPAFFKQKSPRAANTKAFKQKYVI